MHHIMSLLIIGLFACHMLGQVTVALDEDDDDGFTETGHVENEELSGVNSNDHHTSKDKILMEDVKTLTFHRNRMTTARRTHSIHQLSCVGGTAGCKLFTPDAVECEKSGYDKIKRTHMWKCKSEVSERVQFNHVEVICEGYDYPEDDYILVGSCGLEFTLDYTDPHDYHEKSYFNHMDSHEKEKHHDRVRAQVKDSATHQKSGFNYISSLLNNLEPVYFAGLFLLLALIFFAVVRCFRRVNKISCNQLLKISANGPLSSAVLNTKKAC